MATLLPLVMLVVGSLPLAPTPEPIGLARAFAPQFVNVRSFSYRFIELDYNVVDVDGFSDDATGPRIAASFDVQENLFVFGSLGRTKLDAPAGGEVETDISEFGFGLHNPLAENADFVARGWWQWADISGPTADDSETGFALDAGVRVWVLDQVELNAALNYADIDGSDTGFSIGGAYYVTQPLSLRAGLTQFDDTSAVTIGVRYSF